MSADLAWTALEWPGIEHVIVSGDANRFRADGQVVLTDEGLASVSYELWCGPGWRVCSVAITVARAASEQTLELSAAGDGQWLVDGWPAPELTGCIDVDISCTPLTNTLPIRRLPWSPGAAHGIDVVYVLVPSLKVYPARQRYTLLAHDDDQTDPVFRYEAGSFSADLHVDRDGFVTDYPGLWRRVEPAGEQAE